MVVGESARLTGLRDQWIIFLWYIGTLFAYLLASWRMACLCFLSTRARWSAVSLAAAVLTVPIAGTAIVIMDPYLTARSASTPLVLLSVAAFLSSSRRWAVLWMVLAVLVHPLMAAFGILFLAVLALPASWLHGPSEGHSKQAGPGEAEPNASRSGAYYSPEDHPGIIAATAILPAGLVPARATPAYRQAIDMRPFLFVLRWTWYEWLGVAAPIALLLLGSSIRLRGVTPAFCRISRAAVLLATLATLAAILLSSSDRLATLVRLQPMRALQLVYILFFLLLGGLLGEYLLRSRCWPSIMLFPVIAFGMFLIQGAAYPQSRHIEWPGAPPRNAWVAAFQWIGNHTPQSAVFALDPNYILLPGEDQHGFRAIAERSVLSDYVKDSGVVSLFPQLAPEWQQEQQAQQGWARFKLADFQRLARQYPISWVLLTGPTPLGLSCPYRNLAVVVCRIPESSSSR